MTDLAPRRTETEPTVHPGHPRRSTFHIVRQSGIDGLRAYAGTAALIAMALTVAFAVVLPATVFSTLKGSGLQSRLGLFPVRGGDLGLGWREAVQLPAFTQQAAVERLAMLLVGMTVAMVVVAVVTMLVLAGARESARTVDLTVRRAVGASRRVLLGGLALEAALVVAGALAVGGVAAWVLGHIALAKWPGFLRSGTLTLSGLAVAGLAATVAFGILLPILWPRRRLADGETPAPTPLAPTAFQLGIALIMLTASSLVTRYTAELTKASAVPSRDGVVFSVASPGASAPERAAHYAALLRTLATQVPIETASLASPGALVGLGPISTATADCGDCYDEGGIYVPLQSREITHYLVSSDSFRTLGLVLLGGRGLAPSDSWDAPRVAVVSRSFAERHFQNGQAIGRRIRVIDDGEVWSKVVGIVDDLAPTGFGGAMQPRYAVYLSVLQHPPTAAELVVRGPRPGDSARVVQAALGTTAGPSIDLTHGRRESAVMAAESIPSAWFGWWFGVQGWALLALAVIGMFAVMQLWVRSLWNELGARRAVGAKRSQVLGFVLVRAVGVGLAGVLVGLWFGPSIWKVASTALPGLPSWNANIVLRFAILLVGSTVAGALLPAWRAARATPLALIGARG